MGKEALSSHPADGVIWYNLFGGQCGVLPQVEMQVFLGSVWFIIQVYILFSIFKRKFTQRA